MDIITKEINIKGLVQGVGFRPFVYRLASEFQLNGTVENNNLGVYIIIEGQEDKVEGFIKALPNRIPQASHISKLCANKAELRNFSQFRIVKSRSRSEEVTEVSPDIAVCENCLKDMEHQQNRIDYAFTNCTNCGPRFTIIKDLPYDRPKTSMAEFVLCNDCDKEYKDILDRRFHAQPVACNICGPHYKLELDNKSYADINEITDNATKLIESGKILAIKGLGGYHIACDPFNNETVRELRKRKAREGKPLALMFNNIDEIKKYLHVSDEEQKLLISWRRPIVLLKLKKTISEQLALGLDTVGAMLPYMPFHYLLFKKLNIPALVLTSGNFSDEPIIIDNGVARRNLNSIVDGIITYNRRIHNRTDDSVAFVSNNKPRIIRRSRGYAPSPVHLQLNTEGILAAGAELVNCFAIGKGSQVIMSQHIGDLKNLETLEFYKESMKRFSKLFRFKPELVVADMHPEYLSTKFADDLSIETMKVQHHHAHIASCMAENNLDEKVIGISFDGTGYGTDGNIWGGEFLICDLVDFERYTHFEYIKQPGGDATNHHPWRMMLSYLVHYFGEDIVKEKAFLFEGIPHTEIELVGSMISKNINCPLTSSAGRLFDAVAALLGACKNSSYHAEAPMRLEALAGNEKLERKYSYDFGELISFKRCFKEMIEDIENGIDKSTIAMSFHNTIIHLAKHISLKIKEKTAISKIALSGGTFQNRIILGKTEKLLRKSGFEVYSQSNIPSNDGGIALGQIAIAAKRRQLKI
ncbi:MAG: carbamoyltransferase HypF [Chlorobi bacterium]|nr:carbamoyltransferase HypF [Chlorobiota bacterium]